MQSSASSIVNVVIRLSVCTGGVHSCSLQIPVVAVPILWIFCLVFLRNLIIRGCSVLLATAKRALSGHYDIFKWSMVLS